MAEGVHYAQEMQYVYQGATSDQIYRKMTERAHTISINEVL